MLNSRRRFLKSSATIGAAVLVPQVLIQCASPSAQESKVQVKDTMDTSDKGANYIDDLGLQLWTVRDLLAKDELGTLTAVAAAGYKHVELMDTNQLQNLKPICDELGLSIKSSFYNWTAVTGNQAMFLKNNPEARIPELQQIIDESAEAGLTELVFGYMFPQERVSLDDYKLRAEQLNKAGEKIKASGLQQCYHHHSFEFKPLENGLSGWDILVKEMDPELTPFEIDVFWAEIGGKEPVALINQLAHRTHLLHLKDIKKGVNTNFNEAEIDKDAFQEVGDGRLDFDAILKAGAEAKVAYCMVEQDQSPDPIQSIKQSYDYLK